MDTKSLPKNQKPTSDKPSSFVVGESRRKDRTKGGQQKKRTREGKEVTRPPLIPTILAIAVLPLHDFTLGVGTCMLPRRMRRRHIRTSHIPIKQRGQQPDRPLGLNRVIVLLPTIAMGCAGAHH